MDEGGCYFNAQRRWNSYITVILTPVSAGVIDLH